MILADVVLVDLQPKEVARLVMEDYIEAKSDKDVGEGLENSNPKPSL